MKTLFSVIIIIISYSLNAQDIQPENYFYELNDSTLSCMQEVEISDKGIKMSAYYQPTRKGFFLLFSHSLSSDVAKMHIHTDKNKYTLPIKFYDDKTFLVEADVLNKDDIKSLLNETVSGVSFDDNEKIQVTGHNQKYLKVWLYALHNDAKKLKESLQK